jgi:hypothetical protein
MSSLAKKPRPLAEDPAAIIAALDALPVGRRMTPKERERMAEAEAALMSGTPLRARFGR